MSRFSRQLARSVANYVRYELQIALRYLRARRKDAFISITTIFTAVGVMIGVAALIVTLSVMGGFEPSLKERVLSSVRRCRFSTRKDRSTTTPRSRSESSIVPGVNGSDPYIIGQAMLSSGRGIGGVVVRGVEPDNPVSAQSVGRATWSSGGLDDLSRRAIRLPRAPRGPRYDGRDRYRRDSREEAQGQARRSRCAWSHRSSRADGSLSTKAGRFRGRRDFRFGDELHRHQHGVHGSGARAGFLRARRRRSTASISI